MKEAIARPDKARQSLARRLVLIVLLASILFVVFSTAFQLYIDYRREEQRVRDRLEQIRDSYLNSIANTLWSFAEEQLQTQLQGLLNLQDVQYVELRAVDGPVYSVGARPTGDYFSQSFPVCYLRGESVRLIGYLDVYAGLDGPLQRVQDRLVPVLLTQSLQTFLLAGLILFLIEYLVADPLSEIAHYTRQIDLGSRAQPLTLTRHVAPQDELAQVVAAINEMQQRAFESDAARTAAEAALQKSEAKFRQLVSRSQIGIFRSHPDGRLLEANPALFKILGYSPLDLAEAGSLDAIYVHPEERQELLQQVQRGPVSEFEATLRRSDESTVLVAISINPIYAAEGALDYLEGTLTDITARKQAEAERERLWAQLQESAQRLRQIMDVVPEGVLVLDTDLQVTLHNPVANNYLKRLAAGMEIEQNQRLTHLGDHLIAELLTSPPQGLWHEVTAQQQIFQVISRELIVGPQPVGWVLLVRDVTREREIQKSAQQQERLAVVGQLAAGIAHDFNNILAAIVLYGQMGLRVPAVPPTLHEHLQVIVDQGLRASDLINQILDFSRRAVLDRRPLDLTPFIKEQVKLWRRTLPENISIAFQYGADECVINADPTRIQQVLLNLVVNARDAMPDGGELQLGLERLQVTSHSQIPALLLTPGPWIKLTVADTGKGIPAHVLPHIFEPFFTTKEPGQGTGLGLAQVFGIITSHQGQIDVTTQPEQGTTFTLYLPALTASRPVSSLPADADLPLGHDELILVVEDNLTTRAAIVESLEMLQYRTLAAANGKEALQLFEQYHAAIALVLSDMVMPEMGGRALVLALRQRAPTIQIVVMSGHPLDQESDTLRTVGVNAWIQKPPDILQLAQTIADALRQKC